MTTRIKLLALLLITASATTHAQLAPKLRDKLNRGQNTTILFVGDSVTGGLSTGEQLVKTPSGAYVGQYGYTRQFANMLAQAYPTHKVVVYERGLSIISPTNGASICDRPAVTQASYTLNPTKTPTITVIVDGAGGTNILRYNARFENSALANRIGHPITGKTADISASKANQADAVYMMFGINDSNHTGQLDGGLSCYNSYIYQGSSLAIRGESVASFKQGLNNAIIATRKSLAKAASADILLVTPSAVTNSAFNVTPYALAMREVAAANQLPLIDAQKNEAQLTDSIHPNSTGHKGIANLIINDSLGLNSGWYYDANNPGFGFFLDISGNFIGVVNTAYDNAGYATWWQTYGTFNQNYYSAPWAWWQKCTGPTIMNWRLSNSERLNCLTDENVGTGLKPSSIYNPITSNATGNRLEMNWGSRSLNLTKFNITTLGNRTPMSRPDKAPRTGLWWNPSESGRGWEIEAQGNRIFIATTMYDATGTRNVWYSGLLDQGTDGIYRGKLVEWYGGTSPYLFQGGADGNGGYRAPYISNQNIGSISLNFANASKGTLTLPTGEQIPIEYFIK